MSPTPMLHLSVRFLHGNQDVEARLEIPLPSPPTYSTDVERLTTQHGLTATSLVREVMETVKTRGFRPL